MGETKIWVFEAGIWILEAKNRVLEAKIWISEDRIWISEDRIWVLRGPNLSLGGQILCHRAQKMVLIEDIKTKIWVSGAKMMGIRRTERFPLCFSEIRFLWGSCPKVLILKCDRTVHRTVLYSHTFEFHYSTCQETRQNYAL